MPIEFVCPNCQTHLRVPDGTAGQLAACPSCQQHVPIPHANPFVGGPTGDEATGSNLPGGPAAAGAGALGMDFNRPKPASPPPPPPATSPSYTNPYASPTSTDVYEPTTTVGDLTHTQVTIGQLLNDTWAVVSQNVWPVAILGLILVGLMIGIQLISMTLQGISQVALQQNEIIGGFLLVISFIVQQVLSVAIAVIPVRYVINLVRGMSEPYQGAFNFTGREVLRCIGVQFVIVLISFAIMFALALPFGLLFGLVFAMQNGGNDAAALIAIPMGILIGVVFVFLISRVSLAFFFLLDRQQGVMESINSSWRFTKGNALAFIVALLVGGFAAMIVTILTCLVGGIVAWPAFQTIYAVTYFRVTGQPMAIDNR